VEQLTPRSVSVRPDIGADVLFDARWVGPHGIGRFAREIAVRIRMPSLQQGPRPSLPIDPLYLAAILALRRPKLFFSPGYNGPLPLGFRYITSIHDTNFLDLPENSGRFRSTYFERVIGTIVRNASRVLTVSDFSRRRICESFSVDAARVVNVGNGVDRSFRPDGNVLKTGFPYLLYVGNRKPHKNLDRLLEAFTLAEIPQEIKLLLSGVPDRMPSNKIRNLHASNRIQFAGLIPETVLPSYYRGALGFVFPSLYEGFGLPPLEAMACGTPVLTSNVTALPEIVGDAAILVDPTSIEAIAVGIEALVTDRVYATRLSRLGVERASRFSWDAVADHCSDAIIGALSE
jgi:glycosyltransferase involved in cell wall biosynthesis